MGAAAEGALARLGSGLIRLFYSTYDFGRAKDERCRSVIVPKRRAEAAVRRLREDLKPGLVAFVGTNRWLGDEKQWSVEVVGPSSSRFDNPESREDQLRKLRYGDQRRRGEAARA